MSPKAIGQQFQGARFGLVTLHGKESIIAPALARRWQARQLHHSDFDTDSLGTFSGEIERRLSPLECATHKARLAHSLTGAEYGLGSEGSFSTTLWGFGIVNRELIACVNATTELLVVGSHTELVGVAECRYGDTQARALFWQNLPKGQGVMLIGKEHIAKAVISEQEAKTILRGWYGAAIPADVRIAYDLRAHQSPIRRANIALALENLMLRMESACQACGQVGFWPDHIETGLPCGACGFATDNIRARIARCAGCGHEEHNILPITHADPATCPMCNP